VGLKSSAGRGSGGKANLGRGNLLFISDNTKRVAKLPIGAVAAPAPVALNTPSIRKENNGKDISVNLVPVGVSSVWGQADDKKEESMAEQQQLAQQAAQTPQAPAPSVAPWAKKDGSSASGGSPQPSGSSAPQQPSRQQRNWAEFNDEEEGSREVRWEDIIDFFHQKLMFIIVRLTFPFSPFFILTHRTLVGTLLEAQLAIRASANQAHLTASQAQAMAPAQWAPQQAAAADTVAMRG
jgi:hypothetical protein